jgi:hypothetical protein
MLRGQVAVFLSCSDKFKQAVAWPVRDALAEHGMRGIIVSDEPPLPGTEQDAEAKTEAYLSASSAFVALCTADYGLSDGTTFARANTIDEIDRARAYPHLRDRAQILKSPGVLLPSSISATYDQLDVTRPADICAMVLNQLEDWNLAAGPPGPSPLPAESGTDPAGDLDGLFAGSPPGDQEEAQRRVYQLIRDRGLDRRRWVARALQTEILQAPNPARQLTGALLLEAMSRLDASLVPVETIEMLAASPEYPPRSCAANLLRDRAILAPLDVPIGILGRLAVPHREDWYVSAPAMAAVRELVLSRPDAYVVLESLSASAEPQDRHAVAQALLDIAAVRPTAAVAGLARQLADDPDPLVVRQALAVLAAIEQVTDSDQA